MITLSHSGACWGQDQCVLSLQAVLESIRSSCGPLGPTAQLVVLEASLNSCHLRDVHARRILSETTESLECTAERSWSFLQREPRYPSFTPLEMLREQGTLRLDVGAGERKRMSVEEKMCS